MSFVGEITPVKDYDKSTKEVPIQATDLDTGLPLWSVDIVDADSDAKKANRMASVKIPVRVQPVLPEATKTCRSDPPSSTR